MKAAAAGGVVFEVDGRAQCSPADPRWPLLRVLRDELGLSATRQGCGSGHCGACTVLLDGRAVQACVTPLAACEHGAVTTAASADAITARLRAAFIAEQAAQCGFCSSGLLMAAAALLRARARPTETEVRQALDGQLCRCGVHNRVVRAVLRAAAA